MLEQDSTFRSSGPGALKPAPASSRHGVVRRGLEGGNLLRFFPATVRLFGDAFERLTIFFDIHKFAFVCAVWILVALDEISGLWIFDLRAIINRTLARTLTCVFSHHWLLRMWKIVHLEWEGPVLCQ